MFRLKKAQISMVSPSGLALVGLLACRVERKGLRGSRTLCIRAIGTRATKAP